MTHRTFRIGYTDKNKDMDILLENWSELVLALISALSTYTALTETKKDDKILAIAKRIIQAIVLGSVVKNKVSK